MAIVTIKKNRLYFKDLSNAKCFIRCYNAFKADCNGNGTEWCLDSFNGYIEGYNVNLEDITEQQLVDALDL